MLAGSSYITRSIPVKLAITVRWTAATRPLKTIVIVGSWSTSFTLVHARWAMTFLVGAYNTWKKKDGNIWQICEDTVVRKNTPEQNRLRDPWVCTIMTMLVRPSVCYQLVKMFKTLEPHVIIFLSHVAYICISTFPIHWHVKLLFLNIKTWVCWAIVQPVVVS